MFEIMDEYLISSKECVFGEKRFESVSPACINYPSHEFNALYGRRAAQMLDINATLDPVLTWILTRLKDWNGRDFLNQRNVIKEINDVERRIELEELYEHKLVDKYAIKTGSVITRDNVYANLQHPAKQRNVGKEEEEEEVI